MIPTDALVTLDEVKMQVNLVGDDRFNSELQMMSEQATGIIVEYIDDADVTDAYTVETLPTPVHHAILLQVAWMYSHRGDEEDIDGLAPGVESVLRRTRKPAMA